MNVAAHGRIPLWLKLGYTAFVALPAALYLPVHAVLKRLAPPAPRALVGAMAAA